MYNDQFLRSEMLLGRSATAQLAGVHVAVLGLGGVGGAAAEALARAGIGTLTLMDHDCISPSNLNRQIAALHSTLGQPKAEAMAARVLDIHPACRVHARVERYQPETRERFFSSRYDYIIDAIDTVSQKLDLIEQALLRGLPIISALGTGNKLDASLFRVTDLSKTMGCPLARVLRRELSRRGIVHHKVVFSPELPQRAGAADAPERAETAPPGRRSIPSSVPWVPPVAGFLLAGEVILDLLGKKTKGNA